MKLFKKIAKAAGAAAKKDKAAPPAVADRAEAEKQPAAAEGVAVQAADAPSAKAAGQGLEKEKAQQGAPVRAEEEARLRASYNALSQENEELKQRNRFLLQMLAVSRLDEQKLEDQIQQRQEQLGSPNRSVASSVSSPVHRRV